MGGKSSSAPPPDPRLVDANIRGIDTQNSLIQQYLDMQKSLTPIQMEEMRKGIDRADLQYERDTKRQGLLDARDQTQFDFTMDYNQRALDASTRASDGANSAAMTSAGANAMTAQSNARLADNAIKLNDYQYKQMQERDDRWRNVGQKQEDALIAKVDEMGSEKYRNQQMGLAVADVNQGYADSRGQTVREMARRGMDGGGAFGSMMARGTADQALALAGTKNKMRMALNQADLGNKFQLNNSLKGMAAMGDASAGLGVGAISAGKGGYMSAGGGGGFGGMGFGPTNFAGPNAGGGLSLANSGASGIYGGYQGGANMAGGMSQSASGMYSAMGNYKNGQDQIAASNNPWNTILGAATGAGMTYLTGGMSSGGFGGMK